MQKPHQIIFCVKITEAMYTVSLIYVGNYICMYVSMSEVFIVEDLESIDKYRN